MLQSMKAKATAAAASKADPKPIQYVPRPVGLGLGASQVADVSKLKQRKPVELALGLELAADEERAFKSKSPGNELLSRHANYVGIDERVPKRIRMTIEVGSRIFIAAGRHEGLTGKIVKASRTGTNWMVELDVNREIVLVDKGDVQLAALQKSPAVKTTTIDESDPKQSRKQEQSWLFPGLKVRIISKNSFERGKYYNVKGIVLDVHGRAECSLRLLSSPSSSSSSSSASASSVLPSVPQWALETCIPRHADPARPTVRYLTPGEHFHAPFRVLQLDDAQAEAIIQLEEDFTVVLAAKYDDICEFVELY